MLDIVLGTYAVLRLCPGTVYNLEPSADTEICAVITYKNALQSHANGMKEKQRSRGLDSSPGSEVSLSVWGYRCSLRE